MPSWHTLNFAICAILALASSCARAVGGCVLDPLSGEYQGSLFLKNKVGSVEADAQCKDQNTSSPAQMPTQFTAIVTLPLHEDTKPLSRPPSQMPLAAPITFTAQLHQDPPAPATSARVPPVKPPSTLPPMPNKVAEHSVTTKPAVSVAHGPQTDLALSNKTAVIPNGLAVQTASPIERTALTPPVNPPRLAARLWQVTAGDTIKTTLHKWARLDGWSVVWDTEVVDFELLAGGDFEGDIETAVAAFIAAIPQRIDLHIELTANRLIYVTKNSK